MKYLYLYTIVLSILLIPATQLVYAQNIMDQISQMFNELTSGLMGDGGNSNNTGSSSENSSISSPPNQTSSSSPPNQTSSSSPPNQTSSSSPPNQTSSGGGIGSIDELQNLTSGNQELLDNGSSIASNVSLTEGMAKSS